MCSSEITANFWTKEMCACVFWLDQWFTVCQSSRHRLIDMNIYLRTVFCCCCPCCCHCFGYERLMNSLCYEFTKRHCKHKKWWKLRKKDWVYPKNAQPEREREREAVRHKSVLILIGFGFNLVYGYGRRAKFTCTLRVELESKVNFLMNKLTVPCAKIQK